MYVQWKPVNLWGDENKDEEEERANILIMASCGVGVGVFESRSQEWWDCEANGLTEPDFIQNFLLYLSSGSLQRRIWRMMI